MSDAPDLRPSLVLPDWPAPTSVGAFVTTRETGPSQGDFACFNPADHVGDNPDHVALCRRLLQKQVDEERPLLWLNQVHGARVQQAYAAEPPEADAAVAFDRDYACVVLTADCLPVFLCDRRGERVAVAHAGWRGLAGGVLEATVAALGVPPEEQLRLAGAGNLQCPVRGGARGLPGLRRRAPRGRRCLLIPAPIAWATTWLTSIAWRACVWSAWASRISAAATSAPPANRASTPTVAMTAAPAAWPA